MGCCNSKDLITALEPRPKEKKMAVDVNSTEENKAPSTPGMELVAKNKLLLKVLIPGDSGSNKLDYHTCAASSPRSPSPTLVSQRSRSAKKSVTFNPISIVKEYHHGSSSSDKNVTTYICSQLGFDTLSETDSQCDCDADGNEVFTGDLDHLEPHYQVHYDHQHGLNGGETYYSEHYSECGEGGDWRRYEQDLAAECAITESDPGYLSGFDFDYAQSQPGSPHQLYQYHQQQRQERQRQEKSRQEQARLDKQRREQQEDEDAEYEGLHASSYRDSSCVWVCA